MITWFIEYSLNNACFEIQLSLKNECLIKILFWKLLTRSFQIVNEEKK